MSAEIGAAGCSTGITPKSGSANKSDIAELAFLLWPANLDGRGHGARGRFFEIAYGDTSEEVKVCRAYPSAALRRLPDKSLIPTDRYRSAPRPPFGLGK